jgi:hypothetical protein
MDVKERLERAGEDGEVLTTIYHGGSQPGTVRQISPTDLSDDNVWAFCHVENKAKMFKASRIELCDDERAGTLPWAQPPRQERQPVDLAAALTSYVPVEAAGWHVKVSEASVSVHRRGGGGKPEKRGAVTIRFKQDRLTRPWGVFGRSIPARTFKALETAAALFLECVRDEPLVVPEVPAKVRILDLETGARCGWSVTERR